ncbi:MAG: thiamine phosphate synthase [Bacteroides sp.]|nr:thiamine phosphate synthase [Bacteroides sp.]MCM1446865.1 thiamine phosphate synthase [Bacteroides sp.]MCM1515307.1 thiamine phosphate synthase [Paraprevotella sp.]
MKLLLLSSPYFFVEEDKILATLFEEGLDMLHLRKPDSEPVYCERLLTLLPDKYHQRIVTNDHFYLKEEFGLMGIHLSRRNPGIPQNYNGLTTCTCYRLEELSELKKKNHYVILKNIYSSTSGSNNLSQYTHQQLRDASRRGLIDKRVMAQTGITLENIGEIRDLGFGGAVVCNDIWNRFSIHDGIDFKDVIKHFHKLRKATD